MPAPQKRRETETGTDREGREAVNECPAAGGEGPDSRQVGGTRSGGCDQTGSRVVGGGWEGVVLWVVGCGLRVEGWRRIWCCLPLDEVKGEA